MPVFLATHGKKNFQKAKRRKVFHMNALTYNFLTHSRIPLFLGYSFARQPKNPWGQRCAKHEAGSRTIIYI